MAALGRAVGRRAPLAFAAGLVLGAVLSAVVNVTGPCPTARAAQASIDSVNHELELAQWHVARIKQDQVEIAAAIAKRASRRRTVTP